MKNFENLGKKLSKDEQKKINGGIQDGGPGNPCNNGACTQDSQCGHEDCICGTTTQNPNPRCYWLN